MCVVYFVMFFVSFQFQFYMYTKKFMCNFNIKYVIVITIFAGYFLVVNDVVVINNMANVSE